MICWEYNILSNFEFFLTEVAFLKNNRVNSLTLNWLIMIYPNQSNVEKMNSVMIRLLF